MTTKFQFDQNEQNSKKKETPKRTCEAACESLYLFLRSAKPNEFKGETMNVSLQQPCRALWILLFDDTGKKILSKTEFKYMNLLSEPSLAR